MIWLADYLSQFYVVFLISVLDAEVSGCAHCVDYQLGMRR